MASGLLRLSGKVRDDLEPASREEEQSKMKQIDVQGVPLKKKAPRTEPHHFKKDTREENQNSFHRKGLGNAENTLHKGGPIGKRARKE